MQAQRLKYLLHELSPSEREVFKEVLDNRVVRRKKLEGDLNKLSADSIRKALEGLERQKLVERKPAVIGQFDTYLVTADGLELATHTGF